LGTQKGRGEREEGLRSPEFSGERKLGERGSEGRFDTGSPAEIDWVPVRERGCRTVDVAKSIGREDGGKEEKGRRTLLWSVSLEGEKG